MENFQRQVLDSWTDFYVNWLEFWKNYYSNWIKLINPKEAAKKFVEVYEKNLKFFNTAFKVPQKPSWNTPNKVILESERVLLIDFSKENSSDKVLVLPPQAGHHSTIADFSPEQTLVGTFLKNGFGSVYATEWKSATLERKNETIEDFIATTDDCVNRVGKEVILVGLCQGGWQAAIYTALFPEKVKTLVLGGAPIDFHGEDGLINFYAKLLPMDFFENLVNISNGVMKGYFLLNGFKNMQFLEQYYTDYLKLYNNIGDKEYVKRFREFHDWYDYTQDLPGKFYLQVVKELFKENKLVKGELEIRGKRVSLGNIKCPLYLIAGSNDDITLKKQLFNIENYVSSSVIDKTIIPSGHIGLFMGKNALKNYWPCICRRIKD